MITRIDMVNIKGQTASQELSGRDIILGHNGAGKTTRMQAMGLAMMGYVPDHNKTNAATFELSSDDEHMAVGLAVGDMEFERAFDRKEKLGDDGTKTYSLQQNIRIKPSAGERTNTQKEARIQSEVGDFPVMMDFNAFLNMTEMQQRDFIYSLSGSLNLWDRDTIIEKLRANTTRMLTNPDLAEYMEDALEDVISCYSRNADMNAGLTAMVERAKQQLSYWKQEKSKAESAAKKLAEIKNRSSDTDRDMQANIEKLNELKEELSDAVKKEATVEECNKSYIAQQAKIGTLEDEIENYDEEAVGAGIDAEIENLRASMVTDMRDTEEFEKGIDEAEEKLAHPAFKDLGRRCVDLETDLSVAEKMLCLIKNCEESHVCAMDTTGKLKCHNDFSEVKEELEAERARIKEELDPLLELRAQKDIIDAEWMLLTDKLRDADAYNNRAYMKNADIQAKIAALEAEKATSPLNSMREKLEEYRKELECMAYEDIEPYKARTERLTAEIAELERVIDGQKATRTTLIAIKENMIGRGEAEYQMLSWKRISEALGQKGIQGEIIKEMLDPMKAAIDGKIRALQLDGKSFFFRTETDNGKECFVFGWVNSRGDEIPFSALSTGEQALLLTALMSVIISKSNPPVKVLALDNIDRLDRENLMKLIHGIDVIGASFDNVILSGVVEIDDADAPGWRIYRL